MPSANWPLEKIGKCCTASFLCFGLVRLLLEKLLVPAVWPKFKTLDSRVQKDFCVRCTSVVHSVITTYNAYWCLIDEDLAADALRNVSDQHFLTASILSGYFVYDTLMVFADLEAEDGAGGALQTMAHHMFVLGTLPVGLVTNTWAWHGSGVLTFWTELTGPGLNLIWILRTTVGDMHWSYAVNGLVFGVSFTVIRVFVLGYHTFNAGVLVYENWEPVDPDGPDGPLEPVVCKNFIPDMTVGGHGSCQFGFWLLFGIWAIGLVWVPAVASKVYRGASKVLNGGDSKKK